MFEKVNPAHPDKIADRIGGAIVDLAYNKMENPKVSLECLIGHGVCTLVIETNVKLTRKEVKSIVTRIAGKVKLRLKVVQQDPHLAKNQENTIKCGDNGIFRGIPLTQEQKQLSFIVKDLYKRYPTDGKYVLDKGRLIACQSYVDSKELEDRLKLGYVKDCLVNPLGYWTGGYNVDSGALNRKLGSDMADSVTGGGLHGKDLSKADVSVNIYAFLKAQRTNEIVEISCAIGDEYIDGKPYEQVVDIARKYINALGGFEKFAEWGLV